MLSVPRGVEAEVHPEERARAGEDGSVRELSQPACGPVSQAPEAEGRRPLLRLPRQDQGIVRQESGSPPGEGGAVYRLPRPSRGSGEVPAGQDRRGAVPDVPRGYDEQAQEGVPCAVREGPVPDLPQSPCVRPEGAPDGPGSDALPVLPQSPGCPAEKGPQPLLGGQRGLPGVPQSPRLGAEGPAPYRRPPALRPGEVRRLPPGRVPRSASDHSQRQGSLHDLPRQDDGRAEEEG